MQAAAECNIIQHNVGVAHPVHPSPRPSAHLVCQQQTDGLQALLATVHIVTQEQVVGLRGKSAILKEPQEVRILTVYVAC